MITKVKTCFAFFSKVFFMFYLSVLPRFLHHFDEDILCFRIIACASDRLPLDKIHLNPFSHWRGKATWSVYDQGLISYSTKCTFSDKSQSAGIWLPWELYAEWRESDVGWHLRLLEGANRTYLIDLFLSHSLSDISMHSFYDWRQALGQRERGARKATRFVTKGSLSASFTFMTISSLFDRSSRYQIVGSLFVSEVIVSRRNRWSDHSRKVVIPTKRQKKKPRANSMAYKHE